MNMVGTPYSAVHFSACTVSRTASASKLDSVNYDDRLRDNYDVRSTGVIVAVSWL